METITYSEIKDIINDSLKQSMSYKGYRTLVGNLVNKHSTTGLDKSEAMVGYTVLNEQRMKRWDKTIKVNQETAQKLATFNGNVTWLLLTESWCGDAAHVVPAINKVAELSPNINLRLALRDENDALMQQFLTNGGKSIPKLIVIDNVTGEVVNTFGPRPAEATKLVADYKEQHGAVTDELKENLQMWYNKDKGQSTINDLLTLININ